MRVNPIMSRSLYQTKNLKRNKVTEPPVTNQVSCKGTLGTYLGIFAGGAAAVGLAVTVAPVLICSGALLGAVGAMKGDEIEENIKENYKKNKNK